MIPLSSTTAYLKTCAGLTAFLFFLGLSSAVIGQPSNEAVYPLGSAVDTWDDNMNVSGSYIKGVRASEAQALEVGYGSVWVPESLAGEEICLNVQGDNGTYQGTQRLMVASGWSGGVAAIQIETKYNAPPRNLADLTTEDAHARIEVRPCGEYSDDLVLLVTSWKAEIGGRPDDVELLIFAPEIQQISIRVSGETSACEKVPLTAARYNNICAFKVESDLTEFEVRISELEVDAQGEISLRQMPSAFGTVLIK